MTYILQQISSTRLLTIREIYPWDKHNSVSDKSKGSFGSLCSQLHARRLAQISALHFVWRSEWSSENISSIKFNLAVFGDHPRQHTNTNRTVWSLMKTQNEHPRQRDLIGWIRDFSTDDFVTVDQFKSYNIHIRPLFQLRDSIAQSGIKVKSLTTRQMIGSMFSIAAYKSRWSI